VFDRGISGYRQGASVRNVDPAGHVGPDGKDLHQPFAPALSRVCARGSGRHAGPAGRIGRRVALPAPEPAAAGKIERLPGRGGCGSHALICRSAKPRGGPKVPRWNKGGLFARNRGPFSAIDDRSGGKKKTMMMSKSAKPWKLRKIATWTGWRGLSLG